MKIKIDKNSLITRLQIAQNIISQRSTLPVLANYLLETHETDGKLWITSTDLEIGIRSAVSAEVSERGSITLPARKLGEILHSFPGGETNPEVNIELKENNRVQVLGAQSRFQLAGISKEDYPALPKFREGEAFKFPSRLLSDMIKKTLFAASSDEARHILNGSLFTLKSGVVSMVATDGRRLSAVRSNVGLDKEFSVNVPAKALNELSRIISHFEQGSDDSVLIDISGNQIGFRLGETTLFSRLIDGNFPNWEQVIPKKHDIKVRLSREGFLGVTKRAALCVADRLGTCRYRFMKNQCEVTSRTLGHYEFEESEKVLELEGSEGFEVSFHPSYIVDFLKVLNCDDFVIRFTTSVNPALFQHPSNEDYSYVVMPARSQAG